MGNAPVCKETCCAESQNEVNYAAPQYGAPQSFLSRNEDVSMHGCQDTDQYHDMSAQPKSVEMNGGSFKPQQATSGSAQRTAAEWAQHQDEFAHLPKLPDGWIRVKSNSSKGVGGQPRIYYHSLLTGESTFTEPTAPALLVSDRDQAPLPPGWIQTTSRTTGRTYYWNAATETSQFNRPIVASLDLLATPRQSSDAPSTPRQATPSTPRQSADTNGQPPGGGAATAAEWAARQEEFAHLPALPEGWIRVRSRSSGDIYFCSLTTGEVTFTQPTQPSTQASADKVDGLPPGWVTMTSRSTGKTYYWNAALQKSQFEKPTESSAQQPIYGNSEGLPAGWVEMVSRSTGRTFYWNEKLGKSQYDKPT